MGLDVYLYDRSQMDQEERRTKAYRDSGLVDENDDYTPAAVAMSDAERRAKLDELDAAYPYSFATDVPSEKHPTHHCNRRYLRSSYNGGGFNRAVPEMTGDPHATFYDVFEEVIGSGDEYEYRLEPKHIPALERAAAKAKRIAEQIRDGDSLRAVEVTSMMDVGLGRSQLWSKPPTADEVLAWYREATESATRDPNWNAYTTAKGTIFHPGLTVLGVAVGRDVLGSPAAILVYRDGPNEGDAVDHYAATAEIAAEFAEEAIMLIQRDGYAEIHWSA